MLKFAKLFLNLFIALTSKIVYSGVRRLYNNVYLNDTRISYTQHWLSSIDNECKCQILLYNITIGGKFLDWSSPWWVELYGIIDRVVRKITIEACFDQSRRESLVCWSLQSSVQANGRQFYSALTAHGQCWCTLAIWITVVFSEALDQKKHIIKP